MKRYVGALLGSLCLSFGACAAAADTAYVVTYIEVAPASQEQAATLLRKLRTASLKDPGVVRFEVLKRINHPGQFAILEAWSDKAAQEGHGAAGHTRDFRDALKPLQRAPYDERPHTGLSVAAEGGGSTKAAKPGKGAIYAVTHVDIVPKLKDEGVEAVKRLAESGRGGSGNVRFEALTQSSRPNHMTLVEIWPDRKSADAHATAGYTKAFREQLLPMSGSLYDERLYLLVP